MIRRLHEKTCKQTGGGYTNPAAEDGGKEIVKMKKGGHQYCVVESVQDLKGDVWRGEIKDEA